MQLHTYLSFNGNCREAMLFYQYCLGGELSFQTVGASPLSEKMPPAMRNHIVQATLTNGRFILMASDLAADQLLVRGNAVSLTLSCNSEDEIRNCYAKLCNGGTASHPLENNYSGVLFGDLRDKYGNHWILHYRQEPVAQ